MKTDNQEETLTPSWLADKGYTMSAAARRVKRSVQHVRMILIGARTSPKIEAQLRSLPRRAFVYRERIVR